MGDDDGNGGRRHPAQPAPPPTMDQLTSLMAQLLQSQIAESNQRQQQNQNPQVHQPPPQRRQTVKPKAINCRMYKIGENFPSFVSHFRECLKAAYDFRLPTDQAEWDTASLTWLPSKLDPGPTLSAYESLDDTTKSTWAAVKAALETAFSDETEKECFLNDIGYLQRGSKSLIEYKNEILRLMNAHLANLKAVPAEFERQATARFIEGLSEERLRRKLRHHCKRDKNTLNEAYQYVVDYEASNVQSRIREGETVAMVNNGMSALERTTPKILAPIANGAVAAAAAAAEPQLESNIRGLQSKQKINELTLQEIKAKTAYQADRVDTTVKEMEQMAARVAKLEKTVENGFARIERLLAQGANGQGTPMGHFRGAAPNSSNYQRGRGFHPRGPRNVAPSLTGNVGFVNNRVQPTHFRMQEPGSQTPVQPTAPPPSDAAAAAAAFAVDEETPGNIAAAAEAAFPSGASEGASWWSPNMPLVGATGYDENHVDTLSYEARDFVWQ